MKEDNLIQNSTLFNVVCVKQTENLLLIKTLYPNSIVRCSLWCEGKIYRKKEINQLFLAVSCLYADSCPVYLFFSEDHSDRAILQERILFYGIQDLCFFIPSPDCPEKEFPEHVYFPSMALGSLYFKKADILLKNNNRVIYEYLRANFYAEGER